MNYKRSNGRIQRRGSAGRFERSTLANTFGLGSRICPMCGNINPYQLVTYTAVNGISKATRNDPPDLCDCGYRFNTDTTPQQEMNLLICLG